MALDAFARRCRAIAVKVLDCKGPPAAVGFAVGRYPARQCGRVRRVAAFGAARERGCEEWR